MAGCGRLSGSSLREVPGEAEGVLFDCDGVPWSGERAVPGAAELLERLSCNGKATLFVSNDSRRSVAELERRFSRLGFRGVRGEQLRALPATASPPRGRSRCRRGPLRLAPWPRLRAGRRRAPRAAAGCRAAPGRRGRGAAGAGPGVRCPRRLRRPVHLRQAL